MADFQRYKIDFENGTIPIGELTIGDRVFDLSWVWEFRRLPNYSGSGVMKPVTWIVVARDHYVGLEPHVTLLAEEWIGKYAFDNSRNRGGDYRVGDCGRNHWGDSGTANATCGLRPWLNSSGINSGEGFYQAFSESFKQSVLLTNLPNKEWKNGSAYSTQDKVFIPSITELGDSAHKNTYQIGTAYPYFAGYHEIKRCAHLDYVLGWYWTRSPDSYWGYHVWLVYGTGEDKFYSVPAYSDHEAVRPALNLKSETLIAESSYNKRKRPFLKLKAFFRSKQ